MWAQLSGFLVPATEACAFRSTTLLCNTSFAHDSVPAAAPLGALSEAAFQLFASLVLFCLLPLALAFGSDVPLELLILESVTTMSVPHLEH